MPKTGSVAQRALKREREMTKAPTDELKIKRKRMARRGIPRPQVELTHRTEIDIIMRELRNGSYARQMEAAHACEGHPQINYAKIREMQQDSEWTVRYAALYAARWLKPWVPIDCLKRGIQDEEPDVRMLALRVAVDFEEAPDEWFAAHLYDPALCVRREAREACKKRGIPYVPELEDWAEETEDDDFMSPAEKTDNLS